MALQSGDAEKTLTGVDVLYDILGCPLNKLGHLMTFMCKLC